MHKPKPIPTYLAGGRSVVSGRNWRTFLAESLPITAYDPFRDSEQNAIHQFVAQDLLAVSASKLVIAVRFDDSFALHGTAAEMGYATAKGIPIFYVDGAAVPEVFLIGLSRRFFPTLEGLVAWWTKKTAEGLSVL